MRRKKVSIVSKGTICDTVVKVSGKKVFNCHIVRYKWTEKEQAVTILYFQNKQGCVQYDKQGQVIERQHLFRDFNAHFNFDIYNRDNQVRLLVKDNVAKVFVDGKQLKSITNILWQLEVLSDLHEFELTIS